MYEIDIGGRGVSEGVLVGQLDGGLMVLGYVYVVLLVFLHGLFPEF